MENRNRQKIPKTAARLMAPMISRDIRDRVMGDLEEMYLYRLEEKGTVRAVVWYWMQVFRSGFPMLRDVIYWRSAMLRNYIKVALRNLRKQRVYSLINVLGLAVGLACCLFIFLFVQHELSYDAYHEKSDRIYRLTVSGTFGDTDFAIAGVAAPTAAALMQDYPEVEEATRIYTFTRQLNRDLRYGDKAFTEQRVVFADPNVFDVFTIPLISGDDSSALVGPNSIVISDEMSEKYFGDDDPIGKTLTMDG